MMYNALLTAGIALETAKHTSIKSYHTATEWLEETSDALDEKYGRIEPCTGDILCARQYRRHKQGCIGRTEKFDTWARQLI